MGKYWKKILKTIGISISGGLLVTLLFYFSVLLGLFGPLPSNEALSNLKHSQSTEILDVNEKTVGHLYHFYHSSVTYDELPDHFVKALISTEDARFYDHRGVDYWSLMRVLFKTILFQDRSAGGGSTITQQLAKNLYPRADGFLSLPVSKVKEFIIASRIERVYSKQEILVLYLNSVTFSDNTFGAVSAAKTFFNKSVAMLSIEESATLVGMLKATYTYNPRVHPEKSLARRNVVLSQLVSYGHLSEDSAALLMKKPIVLTYKSFNAHDGLAPYFVEQTRKFLADWIKENKKPDGTLYDIYGDGLKIHTTLDVLMQQHAEEAMRTHMTSLQKVFEKNWGNAAPWKKNKVILESALSRTSAFKELKRKGYSINQSIDSLSITQSMNWFSWDGEKQVKASVVDSVLHHISQLQSGFLVIDPKTGAVKVWIGGIDYQYFQFDHISQGKRQVGSTFKPIVYTAALENGTKPCDYFSAREVTYSDREDWKPTNSEEGDFIHKNFSMKAALTQSLNTVSVKILEETGISKVIDQAERMQIKSNLPAVPSLALGSGEVGMLEMAGAFASFVNDRQPVTPYFITKITDKHGNILATFEPEYHEPAFSEKTQAIMIEMLKSVVDKGTASRLRWKYNLTNDIAGKTGTTQANKDGWFVGITPTLVAVSWVGANDGRISFRETRIGQGANSALPVFALFMQKLNEEESLRSVTRTRFPVPSNEIVRLLNCPDEKEDNFFKKLFTDKNKPKTKEFGKPDEEGFFKKLKGIFKKNKN